MDSVLNNVLSLCNQYITKNIETGDKLFDTSLVVLEYKYSNLIYI